jgi:hypothetical protein
MSRLLHAAARGARIGWQALSGQWYPAVSLTDVQSEGGQAAYRIHPNDEHLAYGPISTEVRKAAETIAKKAYLHDVLGHHGLAAIDDYLSRSNEFSYCWNKTMNATAKQKQLFLLILAEFLADEGM